MRLILHPENPQTRAIAQIVEKLRGGALIGYPTDSTYAYGWLPGQKAPQDRVARLRNLDSRHLYALACSDLKQAAQFGRLDNRAFALLKAYTPGPFTFILPATAALPKRLIHEKRRTIGIRVPNHKIVQALLAALGEPLMTSSLTLPEQLDPLYSVDELADALEPQVDIFVDGGPCGYEQTTLLDLSGDSPVLVRQGKGVLDKA